MSGLFGSITIKGNRITDFAEQTGTVGIPIPFGYGTVLVDGNVIWVDAVVTHVKKKKQGKGGVKTEEYTYTRSYAIAFIQGEIYGYLTITRNGKIVYTTDPRAVVEDLEYAEKWAETATFYFGTRDQMPDSTIEAVEGAGQISAFRDLAYIVVENDDVTDQSGAVPTYQAIIIATPPDVIMTSRPYAIEEIEAMKIFSNRVASDPVTTMEDDVIDISGFLIFADLFGDVLTYTDGEPEAVTIQGFLIFADLWGDLGEYDDGEPEAIDIIAGIVSGELFGDLIEYLEYPPEAIDITGGIVSGDLT